MESKHKVVFFYVSLIIVPSIASDTIKSTDFVRDGESIVSAGESTFRLGFFSPGSNSKNRYLGIWYNKVSIQTVVWVANRENPLTNSTGAILKITEEGILVLVNFNGSIIWSSSSTRTAKNPVAQLLDTGNLVVKNEGDDNPDNYLWQSFDYPSDTLLPEMKLGWDLMKGLDRYIRSWKTTEDPSPGNFTYGFIPNGYPEIVMREGSATKFRTGPWNGNLASGLRPNFIYKFIFILNDKEVYYMYHLLNSSLYSRLIINPNGLFQRFVWAAERQEWVLYLTVQTDHCDSYELCGPYGSCNINDSPVCSCLKGFSPKYKSEWNTLKYSNGCVRDTPLNCSGDGFRMYSGMKLPETRNSWFNESMNLEDCKIKCFNNCSCTAYANMDTTGSGCLLWFDDLIDMRRLVDGQDIYIRMAASELDNLIFSKSKAKKQVRIIVITMSSIGTLLTGLALALHVWKKKKQKQNERKVRGDLEIIINTKGQKQDLEVPLFDLGTIASATDNFSINNKLGQGGFGPVYKGSLKDGQEIAVKRLSKSSRQGFDEFKNEVMHIAKLQHRNLVKLLGYCIQSDERMLIYEFMPNKSLDFFIFDQKQSSLLDWPKRYKIISGIARGLMYLHQDSRLRIIHRDLKAGNVLLDNEMNPKISDFGLARSFGGNEKEANTNKVVGTYGYMSPEYTTDGLYSEKSDVFSFGVMILEIVSEKKNRGFYHPEHKHNLLGHAWRLHKEGSSNELIASSMTNTCKISEVLRSIHIGLLCVQRSPEDRPNMSTVVFMLGGEGTLVEPKQPGFFTERDIVEECSSLNNQKACTPNVLSITTIGPR